MQAPGQASHPPERACRVRLEPVARTFGRIDPKRAGCAGRMRSPQSRRMPLATTPTEGSKMHSKAATFIATSILIALCGCSHDGGGTGTLLVPANNASSGGESTIDDATGRPEAGAKTDSNSK